ncbi:MAG: PAS domain-containing protein, partial [Mesorhizobium sp.]
MNQNGSITLFHYWNRLRDGRPAPKRSEVEPADIKSLLADTFILEKDTRGEAVFRLAGTRLCAVYGRELKGFSFPSLWREKDQRLISKLIQGVFDQKSVVLITYE